MQVQKCVVRMSMKEGKEQCRTILGFCIKTLILYILCIYRIMLKYKINVNHVFALYNIIC